MIPAVIGELTSRLSIASPRKDRLPSSYGSTLFCRTCQTNQMLIANLLSNYLPDPDVRTSLAVSHLSVAHVCPCGRCHTGATHVVLPLPQHPEYEQRAAMFPEYKLSVEARYPPICADCAPAVEEEVRRRDNMARARALGGFLGASNPQRRQVARTQRERDKLVRQIMLWKVRGVLWLASLLSALGYHALGEGCHCSSLQI